MPGNETTRPVSHVLLDAAPAGLADWYAAPVTSSQAVVLLGVAQQATQQRLRSGVCSFQVQVLAMICQWWLRSDVHAVHDELVQMTASAHQAALLQLVYGQLLASRKLVPAKQQLTSGFRRAASLLTNAEYFRLLRRHEMLGMLVFGKSPALAQDLPALLAEAAVIERLQRGSRPGHLHTHLDTLG